jgi:hypothetical protein
MELQAKAPCPLRGEEQRSRPFRLVAREAQAAGETEFGTKYEIRGEITGPAGRPAAIVTVWIVLEGEEVARFVSAYPED